MDLKMFQVGIKGFLWGVEDVKGARNSKSRRLFGGNNIVFQDFGV